MQHRTLAWLLAILLPAAVFAQSKGDAHIAGYVEAVLERELRIQGATLKVRDGIVTLEEASLGTEDTSRIIEVLRRIPGVKHVELVTKLPGDPVQGRTPGTRSPTTVETEVNTSGSSFLLRAPLLFESLHADPRWPHFSAAYHHYGNKNELKNVGTVSFGESFSIHRRKLGETSEWEFGLQAGVFAIFDLDAKSMDLVNADYFVGPVLSFRDKNLSALARLYHQSSHLGDEYLLRGGVNRVNLSYEVVDLLVSYDIDEVRLYGGGGHIVHSYPDLKPWTSQAGIEWLGRSFEGGGISPIVAVDVQAREEHDWDRDLSIRAGLQFENPAERSLRFQILIEYYRGKSPNGQFLNQEIEFVGLGFHFHL